MAQVSSAAQLLHAAQFFQLGTPVLHALAIYSTWPRSRLETKLQHVVTWPVAGGRRTFVFQVLSWTLFAVSLLLALPPWHIPNFAYPLDLCMALATFSAGVSLLFMLKSILLFDPGDNEAFHQGSLWRRIARSKDAVQWDVSRLPSKISAFYIVLGLGLLWSVLGAALISVAQQHTNPALQNLYNTFAAVCFTVAAFTTHGLGGHLRYKRKNKGKHSRSNSGSGSADRTRSDGLLDGLSSSPPKSPRHHRRRTITIFNSQQLQDTDFSPKHRSTRSDIPYKITESWPSDINLAAGVGGGIEKNAQQLEGSEHHGVSWRFFQPFRGGTVFVATQAAGWLLYSAALALVLWGIGATTLGFMLGVQAYAVAVGATGVAAQIAIAVSLLAYKSPEVVFHIPKAADIKSIASSVAIVVLLYFQVHAVVAMFGLSFITLPPVHATTMWAVGLSVYYAATGFGAEHSGRREWPRFRYWVGTQAERVLPTLLGSFQVIAAPGAKFDREKRYVFGYAPHGLFPIGAAYLPCTPAFKRIVKNAVDPCTLTASVVFQLPFLRDLLLWVGARVVNRSTFVESLRTRGSVILVPGGQAELVEAYQAAKKKNPALVVCSRHKGFIRLAIQEDAALVPVVAFGEVTSLRNAIVMPRVQRATYKLLGFPIPFLMAGMAGILPLPSRTGLLFVIGKPIEPSQVLQTLLKSSSKEENGTGQFLDEEVLVQALHSEFYGQVKELWDKNKKNFPGYESMPLVLG